MADGYCEVEDVRKAAQEAQLSGAFDTPYIEPAIQGISDWLRKASGRHWYDSTGTAPALVPTISETATTVRLDVPSSYHAQRDQTYHHERGVRYPVTTDGPYARLPLPHAFVESINTLEVRDRAGDVEDWISSSEYQEGRGEDYYLQEEDQEGYGDSVLYIRAASIGPRFNFDGLVTADYTYGLDAATEGWQDVRRGVANLAAAQVVTDDDVLTSIPDNGQLVGVDTQYDQHVAAAIGEAWSYLAPYL
ncbi:hypothetical protein OSG_eHP31_00025 [environmental Halophage eHP-31]|nr:hypothetical protein OSG_eHP31_00025 [environmental Halophage eHP-31]